MSIMQNFGINLNPENLRQHQDRDPDREAFPIMQNNGQRIYSPPVANICIRPPPRGTEVFVGNLPRNVFEEELIPLFSRVGPIYKLRLMMDFSGSTRGFAFINYFTVDAAHSAIFRFDNYAIRDDTRITVYMSLDNCRLFFGNIPKEKTGDEIEGELIKFIDGIVKVIVYAETTNPNLNRGYVFVEFESHSMAAIARRRLLAGVMTLWGKNQKVIVDWAEPEPIIHPSVLMQIKILYFKNVPVKLTPKRFKNWMCNTLGSDDFIERIYKRDNYAFVHFESREAAAAALHKLKAETLVINGEEMEVEWARPIGYSKKLRSNDLPDNLCMSVPPNLRRAVQRAKKNFGAHQICRRSSFSMNANDYFEIGVANNDDYLAAQFRGLSLF